MTYRYFLLVCLLLLAPGWAFAAQVSASLDRDSVQLGETVTLNVHLQDSGGQVAAPDLRVLEPDFQVLRTSQNRSISVVNGKASSELTFGVALRPRHVGVLTIPALDVAGAQTAALQLTVTAADPTAAAASGQDVFMESQVEPSHGYVGQQLAYVVRLYYATPLGGNAPQPGPVDGAEITPLGKALNYQAQRGGRSYQVLEQRYTLVPQRAGTIRIPAVDFEGHTKDPRDPGSFFGLTAPVSASAPPQTIDVKPAPPAFASSAWLPARELSLSLDGWPGAQDAPPRVGQVLNLTMNLQATGLSYEVLPALTLPALDGATVYPDKPVADNRQDGQWLVARRQQSFAIVPDRAGALTIPAMSLKWWNVLDDRMEVATIPAHTIVVLAAAGTAGTVTPAADASPRSDHVGDHAADATSVVTGGTDTFWRWLALGSVALWLLSVVGWWLWRRRKRQAVVDLPNARDPSSRSRQRAFLAAAIGGDAAVQERSLLAWARAERPATQHLGELSLALDDSAQQTAIAALQRRRYGGAPPQDADSQLAAAFKRGFAWCREGAQEKEAGLAPLYPFKLH